MFICLLWESVGSEWTDSWRLSCTFLENQMWLMSRKIKRRGCGYWHSGGGEGDGEREVLTLSKLANRSASRTLWRGGEEGAKGSAKGSLAGREEEEEKSPEVWRKCPRRWKESEDSVLETDALLPDEAETTRSVNPSTPEVEPIMSKIWMIFWTDLEVGGAV